MQEKMGHFSSDVMAAQQNAQELLREKAREVARKEEEIARMRQLVDSMTSTMELERKQTDAAAAAHLSSADTVSIGQSQDAAAPREFARSEGLRAQTPAPLWGCRHAGRREQRSGSTGGKQCAAVETGHFPAILSMVRTSSAEMPGSDKAWPALRTILSCPAGQACDRA